MYLSHSKTLEGSMVGGKKKKKNYLKIPDKQ